MPVIIQKGDCTSGVVYHGKLKEFSVKFHGNYLGTTWDHRREPSGRKRVTPPNNVSCSLVIEKPQTSLS